MRAVVERLTRKYFYAPVACDDDDDFIQKKERESHKPAVVARMQIKDLVVAASHTVSGKLKKS
jgi:hypothetical protein